MYLWGLGLGGIQEQFGTKIYWGLGLYVPEHFLEQHQKFIQHIIDEYSFATLVVSHKGKNQINHIPVIYVANPNGRDLIKGHIALSNPLNELISHGADATAIFHGPHGYISPNMYTDPQEQVPTWNFVNVHVNGPIVKKIEGEWIRDLLTRLAEKHEKSDSPWVANYGDRKMSCLLKAITGFEISIDEITAKTKMGQNLSKENFGSMIENLKRCKDENSQQMAKLMEFKLNFD